MRESAEALVQVRSVEKFESPEGAAPGVVNPDLQVEVVFTSIPATRAALKTAAQLTRNLGACATLLMPYAVPFALPLSMPAVPVSFLEERLRALASEVSMDVSATLYLCREPKQVISKVLRPHSLVLIGGRRRWWGTREQRLARTLRKDGHRVVFVESR